MKFPVLRAQDRSQLADRHQNRLRGQERRQAGDRREGDRAPQAEPTSHAPGEVQLGVPQEPALQPGLAVGVRLPSNRRPDAQADVDRAVRVALEPTSPPCDVPVGEEGPTCDVVSLVWEDRRDAHGDTRGHHHAIVRATETGRAIPRATHNAARFRMNAAILS